MSDNSSIEWLHGTAAKPVTWNCITGCSPVSTECLECYAAGMTKRLAAMGHEKYTNLLGQNHFNGIVKCHESELKKPSSWKKPRRVFVNSMSDTFHDEVPTEFLHKMFAILALCPQHTFLVLTKRAERMFDYFDKQATRHMWAKYALPFTGNECTDGGIPRGCDADVCYGPYPLPNVWLGVSAGAQKFADARFHWLLKTPAAVRFVSAEPLLQYVEPVSGIDQLIIGCESKGIRVGRLGEFQSEEAWIEGASMMVEKCRDLGIAPFVKQIPINGKVSHEPSEWPEQLRVREYPAKVEYAAIAKQLRRQCGWGSRTPILSRLA